MTDSRAAAAPGLSKVAIALTALAIAACASSPQSSRTSPVSAARPVQWATPIPDEPGLPNLHRISDRLYRGGQPAEEGFARLEALGIKTVINLRSGSSDAELCLSHGLEYIEIPMRAWSFEESDVARLLAVVTDPDRQPVFVHCKHGADRTGMVIAVYRIVAEGWSREEAISEMTKGGYGFHALWHSLVDYVREFDIERMKESAR